MNKQSHKRLVRSRQGVVMGVCQGLAEYFGVSVFWLRFATAVAMIITGFFPVAFFYLVLAIMIKPEPIYLHEAGSSTGSADWLSKRLDRL